MIQEPDTDRLNVRSAGRELMNLPLAQVVPSNTNPRLNLEKEQFAELKNSIRANGLLQAILVRPLNGVYEIISGHRRFAAVKELFNELGDRRFATIAAIVTEVDDDLVTVLQLAENVNRSDLSTLEVAGGLARAIESGFAPSRLAEQIGWTKRHLNRYLLIHAAPAWLKGYSTEVVVERRRVDGHGNPVVDDATGRPLYDAERYDGLKFTLMHELVTAANAMRASCKSAVATSSSPSPSARSGNSPHGRHQRDGRRRNCATRYRASTRRAGNLQQRPRRRGLHSTCVG